MLKKLKQYMVLPYKTWVLLAVVKGGSSTGIRSPSRMSVWPMPMVTTDRIWLGMDFHLGRPRGRAGGLHTGRRGAGRSGGRKPYRFGWTVFNSV